MHNVDFLKDLAVVLISASLVTLIFHRIRQPVVLGYILAGILIGPHSLGLGLIKNESAIRILADLGVVFLLFSVGLHFGIRKIRKVGSAALLVALLEIPLLFWLGFQAGIFFGWDRIDAFFLGGMISISSSTVIIKTLVDLGRVRDSSSELVLGILLVEDVMVVILLTFLAGVSGPGLDAAVAMGSIARLFIAIAAAVVLALLVLPRFLKYVARTQSNELFLLTLMGLCLGGAFFALSLGYSSALGAFLMGAVIGEVTDLKKVITLTGPIRDMFSAVFFVAIGLLIEPLDVRAYLLPVIVVSLIVVIGKTLFCTFGALSTGLPVKEALKTGFSMSPLGEFTFIVISFGISAGLASPFMYPFAVSVATITLIIGPNLMKFSGEIADGILKRLPRRVNGFFDFYSARVEGLLDRAREAGPRYIRKVLLRLLLDLSLIAAIFFVVVFVSRTTIFLSLPLPRAHGAHLGVLWLIAIVASLPLYVASFRQLRVLSMILSEVGVMGSKGRARRTMQKFLEQIIYLLGSGAIVLLTLYLSSALLPSKGVFLVVVFLVILLLVFQGRAFLKIYDRAEVRIGKLLEKTENPEKRSRRRRSIIPQAVIDTFKIPGVKTEKGRLIGETALRTETGATIVIIERGTDTIIDPDPEDVLFPGDRILLVGSQAQIQRARVFIEKMFASGPASSFPKNQGRVR